jgi:hypothetical protein
MGREESEPAQQFLPFVILCKASHELNRTVLAFDFPHTAGT